MRYIWTVKAEQRAKELGLEERKAEHEANCGNEPVSGQISIAWLNKGYIKGA